MRSDVAHPRLAIDASVPRRLDALAPIEPIPPRAVTFRSVALGLLGVVLICAITPYNDWVVSNTYLVGNYLPVGLLLLLCALVLLVNAPLARWAPRLSLSHGELGVACAMTLVSCTVASSGLMRYLPSHLVAVWAQAAGNADYQRVMREVAPPDWLFPTFATPEARAGDVVARAGDPVIQQFWTRVPVDDDSFLTRWRAVPWRAWARPAFAWGVLVAAVYGAVTFALLIARRQWAENERLPFPIASVYLALIEPPEPGRALNALFRSRGFWIAAALVFAAHGFNALNAYWPKYWPKVPLRFDLLDVTAERPLVYLEGALRVQKVYFCVVGLTFFLQTKVAFSLWSFYVLINLARMSILTYGSDYTYAMRMDQLFGAVVPFMATVAWVGRHHWAVVGRQMLRGPRPGEPRGRYLPYRFIGWGFVACVAVMIGWLIAAGVTLVASVVCVAMLLTLVMAAARIVAETGLMFVMIPVPLGKVWTFLGADFGAAGVHTTPRSFWTTASLYNVFTHDQRESLAGFMPNAIRVGDESTQPPSTIGQHHGEWRRAAPFVACLAAALAVGYVVAGASMLYSDYSHGVTLDKLQGAPVNLYAMTAATNNNILTPTHQYRPPAYGPPTAHNRWVHFSIGATITTVLSVLRLRYEWWPLHPVGYIVVYSWALTQIWFSIFLGWIAKLIVVRLGGSSLFRTARPMFIGLIVGESLAAACWLIVALTRNTMGLPYEKIMLLPD